MTGTEAMQVLEKIVSWYTKDMAEYPEAIQAATQMFNYYADKAGIEVPEGYQVSLFPEMSEKVLTKVAEKYFLEHEFDPEIELAVDTLIEL